MNKKLLLKTSLYFTVIVSIAIWSLLLYDYYNGGVPKHHLFAKKELPEISNWWGAISIPLVTFLLLHRIKKRFNSENVISIKTLMKVLYSFVIALLYAALLSVLFSFGNSQITGIFFQLILVIALFFPIYKSEYCLGFIIGLTYTFGGVLPIIICSILVVISYLLNSLSQYIILKVKKQI